MPQDKIDLLYNDLQGEYELGSIDDFKSYLSDDKRRALFFNEIVKPRYDVADLGTFENVYGLKKKETFGLGFEKPSEAMRMGGLQKQEKLSQSPLKTAATTTPSVSTKQVKIQPLNVEQIKAANLKSTANINKPQEQVIPKLEAKATEGSIADLSIKKQKYTDGLNLANQEYIKLEQEYAPLMQELEVLGKEYEATQDPELAKQYNELYLQAKPALDKMKMFSENEKILSAGLRNVEQMQDANYEKNYGVGSMVKRGFGNTVANIVNSTGKIIETFGDIAAQGSFASAYAPEAIAQEDDKLTDQLASNIDEYYKRINEAVNKQVPKSFANYSPLSDKPSAAKLLDFGINAFSQLAPTVVAGITTGGIGAAATGFAMEFGGVYDTFHDPIKERYIKQGLSAKEAEAKADLEAGLMSVGVATIIGQLDKFGATEMINAASKKMLAKKITQDALVELGEKTGKEAAESAIKKSLVQNLAAFGKGYGKTVLPEATTEPIQELVAPATADVYEAVTGEEVFDEGLGNKETWINAGNAAVGALMASSPMGVISGASGVTTQGYKKAVSMKDPAEFDKFNAILTAEVDAGITTPEQAQETIETIQKIQKADEQIPSTIQSEVERTAAANLLIEKQSITEEIEGKDAALVAPQKERLKQIDAALNDIATGKFNEQLTKQDEQGRIEEPISAGTDVLETGVGVAVEPSKEGVAGEDIQTETVPQTSLEEQEIEVTPQGKQEKIKVFRGTGDNVKSTENENLLWVAEDKRVAENYAGKKGSVEEIEIEKPKNPYEMNESLTYVKGSDIAFLLREERDKLYEQGKIDDNQYESISNSILEFEKKSGENPELQTTKINKEGNSKLFVDILSSMGFDGVMLKESYYSKSPFKATKTGEESITYAVFKKSPPSTEEVVSERVSEIEPPVVEETTTDVGGVTTPNVSETMPSEETKETAKPTKAERKAIAEAKIDDLAAKAKEFLRNKNLPEGTKVSGVSQDKVIDILASTVKALVNSGIEINEAIKQVREYFEQDFDTSAIKDYEISQAIARDELTDVAKENGFSSYREAVFAVNKYVREVGKEDVITKEEIEKAKEAKDKEAEAPKKGYKSKKKKEAEGEKTTTKETGRSKSYAEGRVPVSDEYNQVVNAQKEYYETMNQKDTLEQAEAYLAEYGDSEQGLLDAFDDMINVFMNNPYLDARNAVAIELLADRMFARALDFQKAGDNATYNRFVRKSEELRKEAFKAHYKAGQFNAAVGVFSRSVHPDAFLSFVNGQVKEGLENFKKTKPNIYNEYEQDVKNFQEKVKDIKKSAAKEAVISSPKSTTKVNVKLSDKLKARYEQGKSRQAEALKKLSKINFFGSSGLSNETIEAVGELVLAQFEQGIYKAATVIDRIIAITEGKLTEKNIKDVYDTYRVNYKGEKRTLTELEDLLRKEEIAEREKAFDLDAELEKEREKLAKLKADYEQAVVDKAEAERLKRSQTESKDAVSQKEKERVSKTKEIATLNDEILKEKERIEKLKAKEDAAQSDRIAAEALKRAQNAVKEQEKKIKDIEAQAAKAAIAKTAEGKRPTISDLLQRDLEADLAKETIAQNLMTEGGLSEREANKLAEVYYNKYRKILKEKIQAQLLKDLTPRKVKEIEDQMNAIEGLPFGKTLGGMISNEVAAGALDSENLRAAFAAKHGIPTVSPIVAANIRSLAAKVRAAKTTIGVNLANKNLLNYINSNIDKKIGSLLTTLYYVSILSGVSTAVVNTYGNVNNLINQSVENFVQSIIEVKQGNKGNIMSNTQAASKIRMAIANMVDSFTAFIDIMAYGGGESKYATIKKNFFGTSQSEDLIIKKKDLKDLGLKKAFKALLKLYKTPPALFVRNLPASDEAFYMSNFNMEATRELRKKLYSEGVRGQELEKKVYEQVYGTNDIKAQALYEAKQELKRIGIDPNSRKLLANRIAKEIISKKLDQTVQNAANELARENTFRGQPRGATGLASKITPQYWLVTPFVSTPFKIAEKMINYIPGYGILRYYGLGITDTLRKVKEIDDVFKKKGVEYAKREGELRNKQLAQVLTGHLLMMVFWGLSQIDWEDEDGKIVPFVDASAGYYGTNKEDREKLREKLPEYMIRVGNFKVSYKTNPLLAMIALPFGVIKDSERAYKDMNISDWMLVYSNIELAMFLYESTPIKSLQNLFENINKVFDIEKEDRTWEDVARVPIQQATTVGASIAVDNIYKQMFDFYDPTKYVVQDNKEVLYKAFNMENIGGLQPDHDRWGRDTKLYPGEAFFPIQYLFKDKTDKDITEWEVKNDLNIPKLNRKTLVLTDGKLKSEKAIENQKKEMMKNYGITSEEYKSFEETLNADYRLLTYGEWNAMDKTVRSEAYSIIKNNFDNTTKEYIEFYKENITSNVKTVKPISQLGRLEAQELIDVLYEKKRMEYINKNFTKIE